MWYSDKGAYHGAEFSNLDKSVTYSAASGAWLGTAVAVGKYDTWFTYASVSPGPDLTFPQHKTSNFFFSDSSSQSFADLSMPSNFDLSHLNASFSLTISRGPIGSLTLDGTVTGLSAVNVIGLSSVDETDSGGGGSGSGGSQVPEPAQLLLFALAGLAAGVVGWRRMPR
jgi:hypothetical protein